ncbi:ABC transporter substrate binding protein [Paenibacillus sp. MER TA 81-3]|uniref:ABC transporter substrate binding protein n=1 Tax=Paenibacillus sp. MER TA 81-3 TaxID=2939573 RepID=UPI00203AB26A|nr:ABC transporter substrate binding protein [Paenibacillus sp. MER TA 81-3]
MKQAAESLVGKVQAIYVPSDNTVVSALSAAVGVANDNKIPPVCGRERFGQERRCGILWL